LPLFVGLWPVSWPPGAWYRGAINAGPAPIDLIMFTQASQYGLVQLLTDTSGVPVAQAPPAALARMAGAPEPVVKSMGQVGLNLAGVAGVPAARGGVIRKRTFPKQVYSSVLVMQWLTWVLPV